MSVENRNVIDIISTDEQGNVILTISDHLEWDDDNEHLLILQEKINSYLESIEGGDLYEKYPNAKNRIVIIRIVCLHSPNKDGELFLRKVKEILENAGHCFQFNRQTLTEG